MMSKKTKFLKVRYKRVITYEVIAIKDKNYPDNGYGLNYIDDDDLNVDVEGFGVKSIAPEIIYDTEGVSFNDDCDAVTYEDITEKKALTLIPVKYAIKYKKGVK